MRQPPWACCHPSPPRYFSDGPLGLETHDIDAFEERLNDLTVDKLRDDLSTTLRSLLVIGPTGIGEQPDGLAAFEDWSPNQASGSEYQPIARREEGTLVVGDQALSWVKDDQRRRTIEWSDVAAVTTWDNGVRRVTGRTGTTIAIVPWNWRSGERLPGLVDQRVAPDRRVRLGEGTTDHHSEDKVAHVRWLGSLAGVKIRDDTYDVVLQTDGLLLLRRHGKIEVAARLAECRSRTRDQLLAENPRSMWIPIDSIASATLEKSPIRLGNKRRAGAIRLAIVGAKPMMLELPSAEQVNVARGELKNSLGTKFKALI